MNYNGWVRAVDELTVSRPSCSYCDEENPSCLATCSTCSKWFCNGSHGTSGSHIVLHLVKSRHMSIKLHPENALGDSTLECYVCRSTNIFSLGFMPSKEESVVVLVCREPCLHSKTLRDLNWDSSTWLPLIEERRLLPWICGVPKVPRKILTLHDITTLELSWGQKQGQLVYDMEKAPNIPLQFKDGDEYMSIFSTLVAMDSEAAKQRKDTVIEDVQCKFQKRIGRKYFFVLKPLPLSEVGINRGDCAAIGVKGSKRTLSCVLTETGTSQTDEESGVFVAHVTSSAQDKKTLDEILASSSVNFALEFNDVSDKRKVEALSTFSRRSTSLSAYLYFTILGHVDKAEERYSETDIELPPKRLSNLNNSQEQAVRTALKKPLTLIQGPPGTGKTSTSVAIVSQLYERVKTQILVCAPSNVAVDHLAERLEAAGLNVVRLQPRCRDVISVAVERLGLDNQVEDFIETSTGHETLKRILGLIRSGENISDEDYNAYKKGTMKIEELILNKADVVCCTCIGAGDSRLREMRFKYVLIDEATQGTEPETLIPLVRGAKQVFLVGDHCQLRPVVFSIAAERTGFRRSLFERLLMMGHRPLRLDVQYRMHPCLSLFISHHFYEGTLQNGVTEGQRDALQVFPWPDGTRPFFFYNSTGPEELGANGSSYLNRTEAALAEQVVTKLIRDGGVSPDGIGVITPYRSQCRFLRNYLSRCGFLPASTYDRVEVSSVDAFQGREKEFIIFSCVRSNHRQGIGFAVDGRRLNVSLTRAKRGLIIMGNVQLFSRYPNWNELLVHMKSLSLIVEGPIDALVPSNVVLHKPRQRTNNDEEEMELPGPS
ncbi:putative nonsense mRNA reducing factor 1 [Trypanosoma vivax]|nr:putative nonsense mRNA reducing factor 1 [Trypanosoma vivax]